LTFVSRTDFARFVDLCRSIDGLIEQLPDDGEAALNRGFHLPNRRMNSSVGSPEERRDLIDTEQCVGVESEREKHLAAGEMLFVERRAIGKNRLKITVTTPYSVKFIPRNDALVAAAWTGRILPELLESPLDARIERLRVDFDDAQLD
jgi:hypothetical protein